MAQSGSHSLPGVRLSTGDDLLDFWQLPAHFAGPFVEHHSLYSDPSRRIRNQHKVEQWGRVSELGRGAFGTVFLERERQGGVRAVKEVQKNIYKGKAMDYLREILAMANLSRDAGYFIQLKGWFSDDRAIYIAMEFAQYGDLHDCVQSPLPETQVRDITQQVVEALEILHSKNFAHRDLKPSNVFVIEKGPSWWVKLGDLGVSKRVANEMTRYRTSIDTDFSAPEVIGYVGAGAEEASSYTKAVDLPLTRPQLIPFCMGKLRLPQQYLKEKFVSSDCMDFVATLLQPEPEARPTASQILKQRWLHESRPGAPSDVHEDPPPPMKDMFTNTLDFGFLSSAIPRKLSRHEIRERAGDASPQDGTRIPTTAEEEFDIDAFEADVRAREHEEELKEQEYVKKKEDIAKRRLEQIAAEEAVYQASLAKLEREIDEREAGKEAAEKSLESLPGDQGKLPEQPPSTEASAVLQTGAETVEKPSEEKVENHFLDQFKQFANTEKIKFQNQRRAQAAEDRTKKLNDLLRFSQTFKLKTPIPNDLVGILAKDPAKREEIVEKAKRESEETESAARSLKPSSSTSTGRFMATLQDPRTRREGHYDEPPPVVRMPTIDYHTTSNENTDSARPRKPERSSWAQVAALDNPNTSAAVTIHPQNSNEHAETQKDLAESYPFKGTSKKAKRNQRRKTAKENK